MIALQWGRGCSAAERLGGQHARIISDARLQWGRGCSAAESGEGQLLTAEYAGFNGAAAVQPRKGHTATAAPAPAPCFNGAAAVQPRKVGRDLHPRGHLLVLQWGRGCSAAERALRSLCGGRPTSFNGAAAVQPRKAAPECSPWETGPRFNGAAAVQPRKGFARRGARRKRGRFNGAAAVQPRKAAGWNQGSNRAAKASMGPRLFSRGKT